MVLINTAGLLQAQAQSTGEETTSQVSDRVAVGEAVGFNTNGSARIDTIDVSMRLAAGADPINLSKASYTIETDGTARVINGKNDTDGPVEFHQLQGLDKKPLILSNQQDLMLVEFTFVSTTNNNANGIDGISPIEDGDEITFIVQAPTGGNTFATLRAPGRIDADGSYILS